MDTKTLICEYCGNLTDHLIPVDDSDPSVGYFDTMMVCAKCVNKRVREVRDRREQGE